MNEQYVDTIHRYLSERMSSDERAAFEAELQGNPTLRNDVELEAMLLAGLEKAGEQTLRETVRSVHAKLQNQGFFANQPETELTIAYTSNRLTMKRFLAIAATLIVLAGAVWFFAIRNSSVETRDLYIEYYQPNIDVQRAKDLVASLESHGLAPVSTDSDSLRAALEMYAAGNYTESLAQLKAYAENHPANDTAQYYIGVIHMSQERYAKAIEILLPVSREEGSAFKNDALWNLGLCYLKTENGEEDARDVFQVLADDPTFDRHRNAKALKEQLLPKKRRSH